MKEALTQYIDRHPLALGTLGTASGLFGGILKAVHVAADLAADIGMLCGGATAAVTLCIAVRKWKRDRWDRKAIDHAVALHDLREGDHLP